MSRPNRTVFVAAAWAVVIFATSCTFIERSVFIHFVERFLPSGVLRNLWVGFWGSFGIFVVKGYHVTEFAVLCYLLQKVFRRKLPTRPRRALLLAALLALLYAAGDEWHQTFVPGRGGTWVDVVIDSLGISVASAVAFSRLRGQNKAPHESRLGN